MKNLKIFCLIELLITTKEVKNLEYFLLSIIQVQKCVESSNLINLIYESFVPSFFNEEARIITRKSELVFGSKCCLSIIMELGLLRIEH